MDLNNEVYREKYLKYKKKYLELKKLEDMLEQDESLSQDGGLKNPLKSMKLKKNVFSRSRVVRKFQLQMRLLS